MLDEFAVMATIVGAPSVEQVVQGYFRGSATTEDEIAARV